MAGPVRVLVVDDSALMRQMVSKALTETGEIDVVDTATDPLDAREKIKQHNPDVLTLDIEMPKMDGISFLDKIMRLRPMPVVMLSTLTAEGAEVTLKALEIGAVDFHLKPKNPGDFAKEAAELRNKVLVAAKSRPDQSPSVSSAKSETKPPQFPGRYTPGAFLAAIGSSTGGVEALHQLISQFPENCPPTVITQHMPEGFTSSFARRLNERVAPQVSEAAHNMDVGPGQVVIAPGGAHHLRVGRSGSVWRCELTEGDPISGHRPSVDALFHSVADSAGPRAIAAILTGMGADGAAGLKAIRDNGGHTVGQNEASCIVYGMPRVAKEMGAVETELPLDKIATKILEHCYRAEGASRNA